MSSVPVAKADPADAEQYRRRLRRDPSSLLFAEFADHLRRAGDTSAATAICARGLLRHPGYATGRVVMGEIFLQAGHPDKAQREWREAVRLDPGHPRAHLRLGELYLAQGERALAVAAIETALLHNPEAAEARALLDRAQGEPDQPQGDLAGARATPAAPPKRRPDWLTANRFEEVVSAVADCASVDGALLANSDGLWLCGSLNAGADSEAGSAAAAALMQEAQRLVTALGAGKLRAVSIRGRDGSLRCLALSEVTLVAALGRRVALGVADAEIEDTIAGLHAGGRAEG